MLRSVQVEQDVSELQPKSRRLLLLRKLSTIVKAAAVQALSAPSQRSAFQSPESHLRKALQRPLADVRSQRS